MKTILVTLCCIVAHCCIANALSLDALRNLITEELTKREESSDEISLGEYLRTTGPAEKFRAVSRRDVPELPEPDCNTVCGHANIKLDTNAKCESRKWRPNYLENSGCECLTGYLCCDGCAHETELRLESCWEQDQSQKGFKYGIWTEDCCGCKAVQCVGCLPVETKIEQCPTGEGARPLDCYTYTELDHHQKEDNECFASHCVESASDAPLDESCDRRCERNSTRTTHCEFDHNVCEGLSVKKDCVNVEKDPLALPLQEKCYEAPVEVDDDEGGHYYDAVKDTCEKCTKWTYAKLSCAVENAAAAKEDCHQFGAKALDRTCFEKTIGKDDCQCDRAECEARVNEVPDKFEEEHVCPIGHVKQEGVTICLKPRDICKKCPAVEVKNPHDCPNGKWVDTTDCNGCPIAECRRASVTSDACASLTYRLDVAANKLICED